jgi:hypothetical protein
VQQAKLSWLFLRIAIGMKSELIPAQKDVRVAPNLGGQYRILSIPSRAPSGPGGQEQSAECRIVNVVQIEKG